MKKVLYISNVEVPYRSEFFNQLSKKVDLTVLYERRKSSNRNERWAKSIKNNYKIRFLNGIKIKSEFSFDLRIIKYIFSKKYTNIVVGCYNSPSQLFAIILMILFRKKFIINIDGEYFIRGEGLKNKLKLFLLSKSDSILIAGKKAKEKLSKLLDGKEIVEYRFSSLNEKEIEHNKIFKNKNKNNSVLVVGQYIPEKGIDLALECAKLDQKIKYKFIGSGNRNKLLEKKVKSMGLNNVEVIPFLQKNELYKEYQQCKCMLLPSRKECWGLVVNEAASFGCPIISTTGSGAAMELLEEQWIVKSGDYKSFYRKILELDKKRYNKELLMRKSTNYSIEKSVSDTLKLFEE